MKKQLILSFVLVFTLALAAPAISYALDNDASVVMVDNKEKKDEKKAEAKSSNCADAPKSTEAKNCGEAAQAKCGDAAKAEAKPCTEQKKACGETKKEKE
ncbi:MAG TPA: hypothetical protein PLK12_07655 [Prolixibacteraceae bacterium]|nr:hypothetical protein [Prolixibacteraceae bacterium]